MTDVNDRRVLRQYEAANAALDEKPSEQTRAAILAAAARAAGARPRPVGGVSRWRLPLAAAASLLVGTIAIMVATRLEEPVPEAPLPEQESKDAVAPAAESTTRSEANAPPPVERADAAKPTTAVGGARRQREDAGRALADVDTIRRPGAAAVAPTVPAPATTTPPAPASAAAAPEPTENREALHAAPAATAPSFAKRAAEGMAEERAAQERADVVATWRASPQAWIEHVVKLRQQGRHDEADAELALLRQRHPDLRLPPTALPPPSR